VDDAELTKMKAELDKEEDRYHHAKEAVWSMDAAAKSVVQVAGGGVGLEMLQPSGAGGSAMTCAQMCTLCGQMCTLCGQMCTLCGQMCTLCGMCGQMCTLCGQMCTLCGGGCGSASGGGATQTLRVVLVHEPEPVKAEAKTNPRTTHRKAT
jgi:hypothetical protein